MPALVGTQSSRHPRSSMRSPAPVAGSDEPELPGLSGTDSLLRYLRWCVGLLVACSLVPVSPAATWYVSKSGNDRNAGTSSAGPILNFLSAYDRAKDGDTIALGAGAYTDASLIAGRLTLVAADGTVTLGCQEPPLLEITGLPLLPLKLCSTSTQPSERLAEITPGAIMMSCGQDVALGGASFRWSVQGPAQVSVSAPESRTPTMLLSHSGTYSITVEVVVPGRSASSATRSIEVLEQQSCGGGTVCTVYTAITTTATTITLGEKLSLNGAVSVSNPPPPLNIAWSSKTTDGGTVSFAAPNTLSTVATFEKVGTYLIYFDVTTDSQCRVIPSSPLQVEVIAGSSCLVEATYPQVVRLPHSGIQPATVDADLTAKSYFNGNSGTAPTWSLATGSPTSVTLFPTGPGQVRASFSAAGRYQLTACSRDCVPAACTNIFITVEGPPPKCDPPTEIQVSPDQTIVLDVLSQGAAVCTTIGATLIPPTRTGSWRLLPFPGGSPFSGGIPTIVTPSSQTTEVCFTAAGKFTFVFRDDTCDVETRTTITVKNGAFQYLKTTRMLDSCACGGGTIVFKNTHPNRSIRVQTKSNCLNSPDPSYRDAMDQVIKPGDSYGWCAGSRWDYSNVSFTSPEELPQNLGAKAKILIPKATEFEKPSSFLLSGIDGTYYLVQASDDLVTWLDLYTVWCETGFVPIEYDASANSRRFYRVQELER